MACPCFTVPCRTDEHEHENMSRLLVPISNLLTWVGAQV